MSSSASRPNRKILLATFGSIILSGFFYTVLVPLTLNYNSTLTREFVVKMAGIFGLLGPVATWVVYLFYKPVEHVIKLLDKDCAVTEEQNRKARRSLTNIPVFLFFLGALSYLTGALVNFAVDLSHGKPMEMGHFLSRLVLAVSTGLLNGVVTGRILNIFLIEAKLKLRIYNLDSRVKGERMETTLGRFMLTIGLMFLFLLSYAVVMHYNHSRAALVHASQVMGEQAGRINASGGLDKNAEWKSISEAYIQQKTLESTHKGFAVMMTALLLVGILLYFVLLEFQGLLRNLSGQVQKLAQGEMDLTRRINIVSFDDIGTMTGGINRIIENLSRTFSGIRALTSDVYSQGRATQETLNGSRHHASEATTIASEVTESTSRQIQGIQSAVQGFGTIVRRIDGSVERIQAQTAAVERTSSAVRKMVESFETVRKAAEESDSIFRTLADSVAKGTGEIQRSLSSTYEINESSIRVSEIARIIGDIADQSNILAMNAAIESSHAGEYGKGFAIVASEIRNLSETTADSTKNIVELIQDMKLKNERGVEIAENLNKIFTQMNEGMLNTGRILSKIVDASRRQSEAATENLRDIETLLATTRTLQDDTVSLRNENTVIEATVRTLNETAGNLQSLNKRLIEGIFFIAESFEVLSKNISQEFEQVSELENRIASYKLEDNRDMRECTQE